MAKRVQQDSVPGLLETTERPHTGARAVADLEEGVPLDIDLDALGVGVGSPSRWLSELRSTARTGRVTEELASSFDQQGVLP